MAGVLTRASLFRPVALVGLMRRLPELESTASVTDDGVGLGPALADVGAGLSRRLARALLSEPIWRGRAPSITWSGPRA